jgi:hypothetical protein
MSIRFAIKSTIDKAKKEGDAIVRFSGTSEPFKGSEERDSTVVGVDGAGNPRIVFNTGLDVEKVDLYRWYSPNEQQAVKKQIQEMRGVIAKNYGGDAVIDPSNAFFWKKNRDVNVLSLTNQDADKFYDTKYVTHALLYLSIISGAFMGMVAPTYTWAHDKQIPLYLALETDDVIDDDEEIRKSDAHAALGRLRAEESTEALFILAWCMQYDTEKYGAFLRSVSKKELVNYHIKFIDGKLRTKSKKDCAKIFLEYAKRWEGQQTRPLLYTEAYVKAGEYFNYLVKRDNKFTTTEGTELGMRITEVVDNLQKAKYSKDLELLREQVEAKWKE